MNYYSIEFFKFYLKQILKQYNSGDANGFKETLKCMASYVKDREINNESAYSKKWMTKPVFK